MLMGLEYSCFSNKYDVILYIFHKNNQMPRLKKVNLKITFENKKKSRQFLDKKKKQTLGIWAEE